MTDTDTIPLLRSICEHPADDTPRLVLADWLEENATAENGYAERAGFVRCQVELASRCTSKQLENIDCIDMFLDPQDRDHQTWKHGVVELRRRDRELLERSGRAWSAPLVHAMANKDSKHMQWDHEHAEFHSTRIVRWSWSRGFISSIRCSWSDFIHVESRLIHVPGGTVECPGCRIFPETMKGQVQPHKCSLCYGSGRIPRPFVASMQPVTEITFTDVPRVDWFDSDMQMVYSPDLPHIGSVDTEEQRDGETATHAFLRHVWPSIEKWSWPIMDDAAEVVAHSDGT